MAFDEWLVYGVWLVENALPWFKHSSGVCTLGTLFVTMAAHIVMTALLKYIFYFVEHLAGIPNLSCSFPFVVSFMVH